MTTIKSALVLALTSMIACGGVAPTSNYPDLDDKPQAIQCATDAYQDLSKWRTLVSDGKVSFETPTGCQRATRAVVKVNHGNSTAHLFIGNVAARANQTLRISANVSAPDNGYVYIQASQGMQPVTSTMNQPLITLETKVNDAPLTIDIAGQAKASSFEGFSFSVENVYYTIE